MSPSHHTPSSDPAPSALAGAANTTPGVPVHLVSGAAAGSAVGVVIGTVLAAAMTVWNELHASAAMLLFAYLTMLYGGVLAVTGAGLGAVTAVLSRLLRRPADGATLLASHAAIIGGAALFAYTARKYTFGLYFADHPQVQSYAAMFAFYLLLVGVCAVLAGAAAALTFVALRSATRRASASLFLATVSTACGVAFIGVLLTQALGSQNVPAASAATRHALAAPPIGHGPVVVIGLDGATWDVLQPLMDQGRVPWLARLARTGTTAPLATLSPTLSPILWTSIATGMLPEKHGIFGFAGLTAPGIRVPIQRIPGFVGLAETLPRVAPELVRTHLVTGAQRRAKALWTIAGEQQRRVAVVNWYVSYPAEPVPGVMVSDRTYEFLTDGGGAESAAGDAPYTHPEALIADLAPLVPRPGDLATELQRFVAADAEELRRELAADDNGPLDTLRFHYLADRFYRDVAQRVRRQVEPDLLLFYLKGIDRIEHHFWKWREPRYFRGVPSEEARKLGEVIDKYYMFTDELLGALLQQLDPDTTVFVISDHGHGAAFNAEGLSGNHSNAPDGIFIAQGPGIRAGARLERSSLLDVAPTVLVAMGQPVAHDMDGRVLTDVFTASFLQAAPVRSIESYGRPGATERAGSETPLDEGIKERLRALGYLN